MYLDASQFHLSSTFLILTCTIHILNIVGLRIEGGLLCTCSVYHLKKLEKCACMTILAYLPMKNMLDKYRKMGLVNL